MSGFLNSIGPEDLLAMLVVTGCLVLKFLGRGDNGTDQLMTSVITYRLGSHAGKSSKKAAVNS